MRSGRARAFSLLLCPGECGEVRLFFHPSKLACRGPRFFHPSKLACRGPRFFHPSKLACRGPPVLRESRVGIGCSVCTRSENALVQTSKAYLNIGSSEGKHVRRI